MTEIVTRLLQPGAIRIEFQPIVRVRPDGVEVYAVEALARGPRGTTMERPDVMFEYARRKGMESLVDLTCIAEAFAASALLPALPLLSINVHASTLAVIEGFTDRVLSAAETFGVAPDRLMFEIVEYHAPWAIEKFGATLDELRAAGVRIAVDDLGARTSNLRMILDCHPDHLKIDRYIVHGCGTDAWRRAVLDSIAALARSCGATAIVEGVETTSELETVLDAGIDIVQGWLYARSTPPQDLANTALFTSRSARQRMKGNGR